MATIIDGKQIAQIIKDRVADRVKRMPAPPNLATILVGDDPGSLVYLAGKEKACNEAGIGFTLHKLPHDTPQEALIDLIDRLNNDAGVHGILPQQPFPSHIDTHEIVSRVDPRKDVDCLNPYNIGLVTAGNPAIPPATPYGIITMLKESNIPMEGKNCVIIGRSNIVGKPMAMLMLMQNATVTICHSKTANLPYITSQADIVIAAMRKPRFVTGEMIKEGAVVIDVGINRLEGKKICGDVDFKSCRDKASYITKVPGGVGPVTIATLLSNCVKAWELCNAAKQ